MLANEGGQAASARAGEIARRASAWLAQRLAGYLSDLEMVVNMDSGTYDREAVNRFGAVVRRRAETWGATIASHDGGAYGDSFAATIRGSGKRAISLLVHLDTVFPLGTAAQRPFAVHGGRAHGPGVCDMKAGILSALYAVDALLALGFDGFGRLRLIATSDEEVGAPSSRAFLEAQAAGSDAALVMEAGRENGDIVGQRKGGGFFRLEVTGRAAHAGVEPEKGRSAILSISRQVVALHALNDVPAGKTITVGTIAGGTRPNVVPDSAVATVDVRAARSDDMQRLLSAIESALEMAALPGTSYTWSPETFRPPWDPNEGTQRLVGLAQTIAVSLDFAMAAASTGGTSDGNFTAALGIPTLDGLGPVGGLDHSPLEYIELDSIVPRTALLAGLIAAISLP